MSSATSPVPVPVCLAMPSTCPVCGATIQGYSMDREIRHVPVLAPLWDGGPLMGTGKVEVRPGPWRCEARPCLHSVDPLNLAQRRVRCARGRAE